MKLTKAQKVKCEVFVEALLERKSVLGMIVDITELDGGGLQMALHDSQLSTTTYKRFNKREEIEKYLLDNSPYLFYTLL